MVATAAASHKSTQHHGTTPASRVLIVGNYCHDLLIQDDTVKAESLGGASSFILNVLNGMAIPCDCVAKVGQDFKYAIHRNPPVVIPASKTTVFHAYFYSGVHHEKGNQDRVLKRVCVCDPIRPMDLPPDVRFDFGMAVGVGGEILPETLEKMIEVCDVVLVDIQSMIREFDHNDGTVNLVNLRDTPFYSLLPRIGVLKASSEEAVFMDVEEVRKWCCVVVTNGEDGCMVYWKDGEMAILPFLANQEDPTGAGDSFLGGFVAGLVQGLDVPDAALLGNFFGAINVEYVGLPKFESWILQRVKDEAQKRKMQCSHYERSDDELKFLKPAGHEQFHAVLGGVKLASLCPIQERQRDPPRSPPAMEQGARLLCNGQPKLAVRPVYEEQIQTTEGKP